MNKILIECLHGIGDTVCMLPILDIVRKNYPNAQIDILLKSIEAKEVVRLSRISFDNIYILDFYQNVKNTIQLVHQLRNTKYDYAISSSITPVKKAKIFMALVDPICWLGLQKNNICFDKIENKMHFVNANIEAIKSICNDVEALTLPRLYPRKKDVDYIKKLFSETECYIEGCKIVGICIGDADFSYKNRFFRSGKVYTRGWGIVKIIDLLSTLRKMSLNVVLIGGKNELNQQEQIFSKLGDNDFISFVGKTNIAQSAALVSLCDCVIGVDTGMQHIADAVGVKTLSIFGPTNPKTHGAYSEKASFIEKNIPCKYCYGTTSYTHCVNRRCLNEIQVHDVVRKLLEIINYQ